MSLTNAFMIALARAFRLSFALALWAGAARADDADLSLGGFVCFRPSAPACVDAAATYANPSGIGGCQNDVDRYVAAAVVYRDCLQRQIEVGVRRVNDVIDRFHCRARRESCQPSVDAAKAPARK